MSIFFNRTKQKQSSSVYSLLKTDMHSHLIPGVDDGSPDLETSIKLIKGLHELGFIKIITTPHIMNDMYRNSPATILPKLELLQEAILTEKIDVQIEAAAEYFLDEGVEELLKKKEKLLTISGNMVLTEFSMVGKPQNLKHIIFEMQMQGYQPVIAHPERYIYLHHNKDVYYDLKYAGCLFQMNLLSIGGHYGKLIQELANWLLKNDMYDLLGTDVHNIRHLQMLQDMSISELLVRLLKNGRFMNAKL